jgi:hypothetical protein
MEPRYGRVTFTTLLRFSFPVVVFTYTAKIFWPSCFVLFRLDPAAV